MGSRNTLAQIDKCTIFSPKICPLYHTVPGRAADSGIGRRRGSGAVGRRRRGPGGWAWQLAGGGGGGAAGAAAAWNRASY